MRTSEPCEHCECWRRLFAVFARTPRRSHGRRGFTLLETMVALALIFAAMAGPVTLASRGIFFTKFSKNKLIAANLAQEGLEIIRKMRDDNILAGRTWDSGFGAGDWQADVFSSSLSAFTGEPLKRDTDSGFYNYTAGPASLFTRRMTISKPSADELFVVSTMSWREGGISRTMTLQETFYHWE